MIDKDFFVTSMPLSRPADYYLGYLGGCIFLDFNNVGQNRVCLKRISFDGYGCCELTEGAVALDSEDSKTFIDIVQDEVKDQKALRRIVTRAIQLNKNLIWADALEQYALV